MSERQKHISTSKIVIVGGGLAGIAAASALAEAGLNVTLLEARSRLGGRTGSFDDSASGLAIDYCQHVGMACCTNLLKLLCRLGIDGEWERQETLHFFSQRGDHLPLKASGLPAPLHLSGLLLRWPELSAVDRARIAWGWWRLMQHRPSPADDRSLAIDWLRTAGQTSSTIDRFWATILVSALGEQMDRVTLGATRKVLIDGFAANRSAYHLLVPQQPLSQLFGDGAIDTLGRQGVSVQSRSVVQKLMWQADRCIGVELQDGSMVRADHVVIAVPWHQVKRLLADSPDLSTLATLRSTVEKIESSPITGIHTWWDRPWLDQPHAILIDRLCQWVFAHPDRHGSEPTNATEHYYQIVISGSRALPRGSSAAVLDAVVADLQSIFPKVADARLVRGKVVTDPHSVFSVSLGQQSNRPSCDMAAPHHLWMAGDWTDTHWPATMEGAIRSGFTVAESITRRFDLAYTFLAPDLPRDTLAQYMIRSR